MILVYVDRRDPNLYYNSSQHHFVGVYIMITVRKPLRYKNNSLRRGLEGLVLF